MELVQEITNTTLLGRSGSWPYRKLRQHHLPLQWRPTTDIPTMTGFRGLDCLQSRLHDNHDDRLHDEQQTDGRPGSLSAVLEKLEVYL